MISFDFRSEVLFKFPIWVRYPRLPLVCWGTDSLCRISSLVGIPLFADECTIKQLRFSYTTIQVQVDVTKHIPPSVLVVRVDGRLFHQQGDVEWAPWLCKKCEKVGHECGVHK